MYDENNFEMVPSNFEIASPWAKLDARLDILLSPRRATTAASGTVCNFENAPPAFWPMLGDPTAERFMYISPVVNGTNLNLPEAQKVVPRRSRRSMIMTLEFLAGFLSSKFRCLQHDTPPSAKIHRNFAAWYAVAWTGGRERPAL